MKFPSGTQCYCCEKTATTKDHIPPKCFFPEKKHLPNNSSDYRRNLITVPSCSEHNNFRSHDDEYTAAVIAMSSENNLALAILKSKWIKVLLRNEGSLGKRIFAQAQPVRTIHQHNKLLIPRETLAITYELERIENVIKSIARGIYYLELQNKWVDDIDIIIPKALYKNLKPRQDINKWETINQCFIRLTAHEQFELTKKGSNPDIFYYQFFKLEKNSDYMIRIVFYNYFVIFAILKKRHIFSDTYE